MTDLADIAPAFVAMAHRIVWCTVTTVDRRDRPRSRILHPFWIWDGTELVGWIATAVGYDPAIIPAWKDGPTSDAFAVMRLEPWRLRVIPGAVMTQRVGEPLTWSG